jgi:hypothetical protein
MSSSVLDISKPLNASLPRQQLPLKKKLEEMDKYGNSKWMKDCLDSLEALGRYQFYQNLALRDNYRIVSKEFDLKHYMDSSNYYDITSAVTQEFEVPYHLKHYDIIGKAIMMLVGEYVKKPDIFFVRASDSESTNERVRVKTQLLQSYMQQEIQKEITRKLVEMGLDPDRKEFKDEQEAQQYQEEIKQKYKELTPEGIEKYMKYDYRTSAEHWGQAVLSNDRIRFNFKELEKVEFTDMLIADRCFSHMYLTPTGYNLEYWNPINTFFHQSPEVRYVEEGDYAGRVFYMNKSQAIDRFGWRMQEEQIRMLYPKDMTDRAGNVYGEFFNATQFPFPAYRDYANVTTSLGYDPFNNTPVGNLPALTTEDLNTGFPNYQFATGDLVQITEGYWRSQRRIGFLKTTDPETGEPISTMVDDNFVPSQFGIEELKNTSVAKGLDTQPDNTVLWTWVTHIWQGCKINANFSQSVEDRDRNAIYFDIKPCDFQFKGDYTPFQPKLPICGGVFNNRNAKSNSLVDLMKPYQIAYNAFMNLAYGIAQRNNGKFFIMDARVLSNFKDWGGEQAAQKAMTIAKELGWLPIDPSSSNLAGGGQFNQFAVHDLDESDKVSRLIQLAVTFEEQGFKQIGITPQRQGQVQASETATGVTASINNSYSVTEPYFENFYNYKRRKLKMLLDLAQYVASKEKDIILTYTTSDLGNAFIKTTGTEVMLRDLGVNVDNSQDAIQDLEFAKKIALQNNTTGLPMSALISMISLKSPKDIQKALEDAEDKLNQQKQAEQQHQQEMQQEQIKAAKEQQAQQQAFEAQQNQLDRENEIRRAMISSMGFDQDIQGNNMIDVVEQGKLAIDQSKQAFDQSIQTQQIAQGQMDSIRKHQLEKEKVNLTQKQIDLKEKEIKSREQQERLKNQGIMEQNKNQIQLSNKKHESDMKIANKQLEMKDMEAQTAEKIGKIKINLANIQAQKAKQKPKK